MADKITIGYAPSFVRQYDKLEPRLREEVKTRIGLFQDRNNHKQLDVHKLHGRLKDRLSFSVNYKIRIVFEFQGKGTAILKAIGDHEIY